MPSAAAGAGRLRRRHRPWLLPWAGASTTRCGTARGRLGRAGLWVLAAVAVFVVAAAPVRGSFGRGRRNFFDAAAAFYSWWRQSCGFARATAGGLGGCGGLGG